MRTPITETKRPVEPEGEYALIRLYVVDDGYEIQVSRSDNNMKPYSVLLTAEELRHIAKAVIKREASN